MRVICSLLQMAFLLHLHVQAENATNWFSGILPRWNYRHLLTRKWPINAPWSPDLEHEGSEEIRSNSSIKVKTIDDSLTWTILTKTKVNLEPTSTMIIYTTPSFFVKSDVPKLEESSISSLPDLEMSLSSRSQPSLPSQSDFSSELSFSVYSSKLPTHFQNSPFFVPDQATPPLKDSGVITTLPIASYPVISSTHDSSMHPSSSFIQPSLIQSSPSFIQSSPSFIQPSSPILNEPLSTFDQSLSLHNITLDSSGQSLPITVDMASSNNVNSLLHPSTSLPNQVTSNTPIDEQSISSSFPQMSPSLPISPTPQSDSSMNLLNLASALFSISFNSPSFNSSSSTKDGKNITKNATDQHLVTSVILNSGISSGLFNLTSEIEDRLEKAFIIAYQRHLNTTTPQNFTIKLWHINADSSNERISLVYEVIKDGDHRISNKLVQQVLDQLSDSEMAAILGTNKVLSKAEPYVKYEPIRQPTNDSGGLVIRTALLALLEPWQVWLLAAFALILLLCCCCGGLFCWWKERKLQRMLIRRLAQEHFSAASSLKISQPITSSKKAQPPYSNTSTFGPWRKGKRAGASSPSNEFEYISFTSDTSSNAANSVGYPSAQNTLASAASDQPAHLISRAVQSGHRRNGSIAMSTLDWPSSTRSKSQRVKPSDSSPIERVIPILIEEQNWSEDELDTDRLSFERLQTSAPEVKRVYFGQPDHLTNDKGLSNLNIPVQSNDGRGPTILKHELIEEYEVTKHSSDRPGSAVQDLLQVQIDEQTRSIISAIRNELKRFTPQEICQVHT